MAKKRNNRRTVEEQVEVAPRSYGTTPVGMNPLCQQQSLVSGENLFLSLRPAYEMQVWGFGVREPKRKRHRTPHPATVRRPEAGAAPRLHILSI